MPYNQKAGKSPLGFHSLQQKPALSSGGLKTKIFFNVNQNKNQEQKTKILTKILGGIFLSTLFFTLSFVPQAKALILTAGEQIPSAPTILTPESVHISQSKPLISGVVLNDTEVEIYIDNELAGVAKTQNGPKGTAHFVYKPNLPLKTGHHEIRVRAKSITNPILISLFSSTKQIEIDSLPAPTLIEPADNLELSTGTPVIKGLVKNDSYVKIYINDQETAGFTIQNQESGVANFTYKTKPLKNGNYVVYAKALDLTNTKESKESNQIHLKILPYTAPTILSPKNEIVTLNDSLIVAGVALNDSKIIVYVDGKIDGKTAIKNHPSGTGSFAYKTQPLKRGQAHLITATAIDRTGRESNYSKEIRVVVNYYYIAPTLLQIQSFNKQQPVIIGLAKNDSKVEILVNNKIDGSFIVENHSSGTANFAYKIKTYLTGGTYKIESRAYDLDNKVSLISNSLPYYLAIGKPIVKEAPTEEITPKTVEEKEAGKIETKDEEQGKVAIPPEIKEEETEKDKTETGETTDTNDTDIQPTLNSPLIAGLVILGVLIIIFVIWYLKQKRQDKEENLDDLFGPEVSDDVSQSNKGGIEKQKETKIQDSLDDFGGNDFDLDKEKEMKNNIPPPPPSL